MAGNNSTSEMPVALHLAEKEFNARFPVDLGRDKLQIGSLPYSFLVSQSEERRDGRLLRTSTVMGRGPRTLSLVILVYVNVRLGPDGDAEAARLGQLLGTIVGSFAPAP